MIRQLDQLLTNNINFAENYPTPYFGGLVLLNSWSCFPRKKISALWLLTVIQLSKTRGIVWKRQSVSIKSCFSSKQQAFCEFVHEFRLEFISLKKTAPITYWAEVDCRANHSCHLRSSCNHRLQSIFRECQTVVVHDRVVVVRLAIIRTLSQVYSSKLIICVYNKQFFS